MNEAEAKTGGDRGEQYLFCNENEKLGLRKKRKELFHRRKLMGVTETSKNQVLRDAVYRGGGRT